MGIGIRSMKGLPIPKKQRYLLLLIHEQLPAIICASQTNVQLGLQKNKVAGDLSKFNDNMRT